MVFLGPLCYNNRKNTGREVLYLQEHSVEITLTHPDDLFHLFGSNERHLRLMEQEFGVTIHARTEIVQIIGEEETCEQVRQVIQALLVSR